MVILLLLVIAAAGVMILLARRVGRVQDDAAPAAAAPEAPAPEQTGLGEPEWNVVIRAQCAPTNCPNFKGNPRQPGKEPGCQVCAAMFLERYGERILKQEREGRNK